MKKNILIILTLASFFIIYITTSFAKSHLTVTVTNNTGNNQYNGSQVLLRPNAPFVSLKHIVKMGDTNTVKQPLFGWENTVFLQPYMVDYALTLHNVEIGRKDTSLSVTLEKDNTCGKAIYGTRDKICVRASSSDYGKCQCIAALGRIHIATW